MSRYIRKTNTEFTVAKCGECGLECTFPIPTEARLQEFYRGYQDIRADPRIVEINSEGHLHVLRQYGWSSKSKTLDFGTGNGVFLDAAGENCFGTDWISTGHPRARPRLADFDGWTWDFVTLWGVLEHLAQPKETVRNLTARLKQGGILALTTVDAEGNIPYYYKPPEHLSYWTYSAFAALAQACGLEIKDSHSYWMYQRSDIYLARLLSRTPAEYQGKISHSLPDIVYVPTNEVRVVLRKVRQPTEA